ncbi:hypothetical protein DFJ74DRAFT_299954 [Hyaloraphidium curvatum]|nr:hypothetical protein DFJ74DRAFT_299954 [Hyaloraphidium curvatum]
MLGDGDSGAAAPRPTKAAVAEAEKKVRGERAGDALEAARAVAVERGLSREAAAAAAGTRELRELLRRLPKTTYLDECAVLNAHSLVVRGGVEEDWQGRISKERARAMAFNRACWEKQEENNNRQRSKREVLRIMRLYRTIDEWSSPSGNSKSKGTSCTGQQTPTSGTPPVLPPPPAHAGSACSCSEHVEHLAQSAPSDHARAGTECEDTIIAEIQHLLDGVHDEGGEDYNEAEEDANWAKLGELVRRLGLDLDSLEQLTEDELGGDEDPLRLRGGAPPFEQDRKRKAPDAAAGKNNDSEPGENAVKGARSPNARQPPSGQEHLGESSAEANKKPRKGKSKADATPHALADHPLLTRTPTAPKKGKAKQPKDDGAVSGSGQPQVGQGVLGQADTEQPLWVTGDPFNLPDREQRLTAAREETQRRQAQQLVRKFGLKDLDPEVAQVDPLSIKPTETILKEAKAAVLLQYPKTLAWIERDDGGEEGRRQRSKIFGRSVIKQLLKLYILVAMNRVGWNGMAL